MRLKAICCDLYMRALAAAIARSKNKIDPEFIKFDSSENPEIITPRIQAIIDSAITSNYNAVLILLPCERWTKSLNGLSINKIPIVLPKKLICRQSLCKQSNSFSDTIKNQARDDWVFAWEIEHLQSDADGRPEEINKNVRDFNNKPIDLFNTSSLLLWERETEIEAEWFGWDFERLIMDFNIVQRLVDGYWSYEDFIVLMPGTQLNFDIYTNNQSINNVHT